jgi:hypothetical protein
VITPYYRVADLAQIRQRIVELGAKTALVDIELPGFQLA